MHRLVSVIYGYKSLLLLQSVVLYSLSVVLPLATRTLEHRWLTMSLHLTSLFIIVFLYFLQTPGATRFIKKEFFPLLFLFLISIAVNFWALSSYPFVSVGDALRDSGLKARDIFTGNNMNIFGYDEYFGFGLSIPTLSSFFYGIFGASVLTYRVPSAIISVFEILFFYILIRKMSDKLTALISTATLLAFPLHLFFSRTEPVISFDSFWTTVFLIALYFLMNKKRTLDYIFTGTLSGFAAQFHNAVKAVVILGIFFIFIFTFVTLFKKCKKILPASLYTGRLFVIFIVFFFVGFGPHILFSNSTTFFQLPTLKYERSTGQINSQRILGSLPYAYEKSLMVWFWEPTQMSYPVKKPLLTPILALLFLLGIAYGLIILKRPIVIFLFILVLAVPLTNSALPMFLT